MSDASLSIRKLSLWLLPVVALLTGYALRAPEPVAPVLSVQIVNLSSRDIVRVEIQHGNADTEERILLHRIARDADRTIGLNHQPGLGYDLQIFFADGDRLQVCGGKLDDAWFISELVRDDDLETIAGPYR
jgi:hypothetical protein